ncbi:MAG: restriction endonuclease subunit S [Stenotrophomonas lactitubi]|uniref:restriction endonuclease subunit S n=1 Tax=Stenotrophomonas lactitubi TaxID=2045214 RepID=UPI003D1047C6
MSNRPDGWETFTIADIGGLSGGSTPSKANSNFWANGDVPWASPKDMKKLHLHQTEDRISRTALYSAGVTLYPSGTLLMVTRSGILQHSFPVALAATDLTINQDIKAVLPHPEIASSFLLAALRNYGQDILDTCSKSGTTVQSIDSEKLEHFEIPLPPLKEQERIARKLDTLLAQVDAIRARIDAIPVLLKRFRQAVRVVALAGELERGKLMDSAKWKSCVLSDIALVETGKTPDRSEPKYWTNGSIAWVTSAATGASTCEEAKEFVTHQAAKECNLKIFAPETLLLAMYGEGKTRGQVTELRIHAACNQACAAISVDKNLAELGFVKLRLEENYEEIRKMAAGGAQPNLNLGKVREISISLPPQEIQADIVGHVDQLFTFAGQLEAQALAAKQRIDALTQSILAKAFRGELVPQDPNDEPASVVLERIRAQRAAAPKPKRGRKAASN